MPEFKLNGKTYSGSTNYASAISYTEDDGSKTTVQDKISELNSNLGKDESGMTIHEKLDNLKQVIKEDFTCTIPYVGVNSYFGGATVFKFNNPTKYKYLKITCSGNFGTVVYGDNTKMLDQTNSVNKEVILEIENISVLELKHSQTGAAAGGATLIFTDNI